MEVLKLDPFEFEFEKDGIRENCPVDGCRGPVLSFYQIKEGNRTTGKIQSIIELEKHKADCPMMLFAKSQKAINN